MDAFFAWGLYKLVQLNYLVNLPPAWTTDAPVGVEMLHVGWITISGKVGMLCKTKNKNGMQLFVNPHEHILFSIEHIRCWNKNISPFRGKKIILTLIDWFFLICYATHATHLKKVGRG